MKIIFLGTGAADWSIYKHRNIEGFRRNSSMLIDGCLLIDPNSNIPDALTEFHIARDKIKYIINTHKHSDHYDEATVRYLSNAKYYPLSAGDDAVIGKYTVKALKANHSTCEEAVHFIITDGQSSIFYGLDGAWLMYDEVVQIKKHKIDFAVFDATVGNIEGDYRIFEHNMVIEMKRSLEPYIKRFCISHMARTLHTSHKELCEYMKKFDIEVAFDGYRVELSLESEQKNESKQ